MTFDQPTYAGPLLGILMLSLLQVSCTGEIADNDCPQVEQEVGTFVAENIVPLMNNDEPPKVERAVVAELRRIRERVRTCSLPNTPANATSWDEEKFARLDGQLVFFQVTLEQAAEEDNPEITRILVNSPGFATAVQDLREMLQLDAG